MLRNTTPESAPLPFIELGFDLQRCVTLQKHLIFVERNMPYGS